MPPTQFLEFKDAVRSVAKILTNIKDQKQYYAAIAFLKFHPKVNEVLFQHAVEAADMHNEGSLHVKLDPTKASDFVIYNIQNVIDALE